MLGIFDSGIGGLTVVRELLSKYPDVDFTYLGDTAHAPYGDKSVSTIQKYAHNDVLFLYNQGIRFIIVACNTVASTSMESLQASFPDVTFVDVVTAGTNPNLQWGENIAIIGTRATIGSNTYSNRIRQHHPDANVTQISCPLFVPWIEAGLTNWDETSKIIDHYLSPLSLHSPDQLVLGCTHYPMLSDQIDKYFNHQVSLINPSRAVVDQLAGDNLENHHNQTIYLSDDSPHTRELINEFLPHHIPITPIELSHK
ncbi:MAG: glutamate racemase [Patescibacteria group bacterium]